ncbi:MAG: ABC transporter permease [Erysipelotrichaceae bacterium]|jgi:spermidine/putrescine transport system permease protein|nr:ABC transporter permease [Erysipelotrichaceae bacterium]
MKFRRKYLAIPYVVFLFLFIIFPIFVIIFYAFTDSSNHFSLDQVINFFTDSSKIMVLVVSVFFAILNTAICLLIGYPIAYFLARKDYNKNTVLFFLFIMPMWINFVLRTSATRDLLFLIGLDGGHYPYLATTIGLVYNYLPFVILPLYSTMIKLDNSQMEAAADLGCNKMQVFFKSVIPQTMPGIVSAIIMTFMPTMTTYVISDTLSERNIVLLGSSIASAFDNNNWNSGSFLAMIMLIIVFISMIVTNRFTKKSEVSESIW